jgi:phospholipid/cholesterol/gamma-HCH transport system substrate-binding protein
LNPADDRRKAGVFVLVSLGLLLLLAVILAGVRFLSRDRSYVAEFRESVAGLEPSSPVKYNGVPVGSVTGIRFDPDDLQTILVDFKVRPEVPMKRDTRAVLQAQGITGILYLELRGGTLKAKDLGKDERIPSDPSFTAKVTGIARDLSELVTRLNSFVSANADNLTYAITDFRASAGSIRTTLEKVDKLAERAGSVIDGGAATMEEGRQAAREARLAMEDLRREVTETGEAMRKAVAPLEEVLADPELKALPGKASKTLDLMNEKVASADLKGLIDRVTAAVEEFQRIEANLARATEALARAAEDGRRDVGAARAT